jgi:predicted flap endonuclease-1-like 5' DNA nuclease
MNHTAKNLIRVAGVVVGIGAAVWAMRDRLLPSPEVHDEAPPRFREAPSSPVPSQATAEPSSPGAGDVTEIKGIGPVTAGKLASAGVTDVAAVAASTASDLATAAGVSETVAGRWIAAAKTIS